MIIRLHDGEQLLDEQRDLVGLRTIALDRSEDPEGGQHFRFVLNGVPIFARGAAWLPADMLVGSVSEARYRELLTTARDGQMIMLRIWGGGIYEHNAFYNLCDELGLLVWQDFAFACIDYPDDDPRLRTEIEQEAAYQVRRLRNHASRSTARMRSRPSTAYSMETGMRGRCGTASTSAPVAPSSHRWGSPGSTGGMPLTGASSSASSAFTPLLSWPPSGGGCRKINFRSTVPVSIITTKTIRRTSMIRCWRSSPDCRAASSSTSTSP